MTSQETLNVRVVKKQAEAEGIASFELARVDGAALPPFSAGSHIDVHLPGGLTRQYSLCNASHESHRYPSPCCETPPRVEVLSTCTIACTKAM